MILRRLFSLIPTRILANPSVNAFTTSAALQNRIGSEDRHAMLKSMPKKDDGSIGERSLDLDIAGYTKLVDFPDRNTPDRIFDNIPFKLLPIVTIYATRNNTHFTLTNHEGQPVYSRSCGVDGFKNCRKGTNIAAQVTAQAFGKMIFKKGYPTVRVCVNGLGAGRMSSFKGIMQAGINIVSITDSTKIFDYPRQRPPAARSL